MNEMPKRAACGLLIALGAGASAPAQDGGARPTYLEQLETTPEGRRAAAEAARGDLEAFRERIPAIERMQPEAMRLRSAQPEARLRARPEAVGAAPREPLVNPPEAPEPDARGRLKYLLDVRYGDNEIYNAKLDRAVPVHLRSYNGRLLGETIRIRPGDLMEITTRNSLPVPASPPATGDINVPDPANFNTTNLHTHGLHVTPAGNGDNVLMTVPPGTEFRNEIAVGEGHAPGTFWYHSHVHGSTAIQVSSGMAGVLIVRGGLDDVPEIKAAEESILLFQQIPYSESAARPGVYEIESYNRLGPAQWNQGVLNEGWRTTINGQVQPVIYMQPKEVQRWRMVHAGLRESIRLAIVPVPKLVEQLNGRLAEPAALQDVSTEAVRRRREQLAEGSPKLHEVAADGLAYGFTWTRDDVELEPGYRSDVLVRIDEPGKYAVIDGEDSPEESLWRRYEPLRVVAFIDVEGPEKPMALPGNDKLAGLRPHRDVAAEEVALPPLPGTTAPRKRLQKAEFNIDLDFSPPRFQINSQSYNPSALPITLELNRAYEWILASRFVNHPFHIHVNPFEIVEWTDQAGRPRLPVIDGVRRTIWKDTILTRAKVAGAPNDAEKLRVRSRNEDYIGRFVLHCHILDHEDQGMMQEVEIVGPGASHHGVPVSPHAPSPAGHGHGGGR